MSVPFFDAARAARADEAALTTAFLRVLRSGRYILGDEVSSFERAVAARLGAAEAVGVSSGTDALLVTLAALDVGRGDEVIVPAYGFVATAEVVVRLGAKPVFVDVRPSDLCIDAALVAPRLTARTRAVVAVHLFGAPADVEAIAKLGVPVVEDAAQAFGASRNGQPVGVLGVAGCFSFFPTKNLGGLGDAGLVASNDVDLTRRLRSLRSHGQATPGVFAEIGGNFRLDALHAALLAARLSALPASLSRRRAIAARYVERLRASIPGAFEPLRAEAGATFNQFVVRVADGIDRDTLHQRLATFGIGTQIYYARALQDQPCFASFEPRGDFAAARAAARTTLALPCYPELEDAEVNEVVAALAKCVG